jgi:glycosyltransferase involved in cell wall biosynthesis
MSEGNATLVAPLEKHLLGDRLCVIVPAFNEATCIEEFHRRLSAVMDTLGPWQVIYVNDGSTDDTLAILKRLRTHDSHVALVNLSRNFGKELAMTAGLDHASGEAIIVIDADLQDPPEVIPRLVAAWRDGYDIVYAQRSIRMGETWFKRTTANLFYRLMQDVPPNGTTGSCGTSQSKASPVLPLCH